MRERSDPAPSRTDGGRARPQGSRRWIAVDLLRRLVLRVHHGWEALPPRSRRAWWVGMGAGLLAVEVLVLALVWAAWSMEEAGILHWEAGVVRWLDTQQYLSFNFGLWLEGPANGFVLWFVVLYASGVAGWRERPLIALSLLTGYTLMYLPIVTGWIAWDRPRPMLIAGGIGSPGGVFRSFPSGHTIQAVFAYGFLAYLWFRLAPRRLERATIVLLYLLVLCAVTAGRLRLGAHWPSDVVAGLLIGAAWLAAVLATLRRAERERDAGNPSGPSDI